MSARLGAYLLLLLCLLTLSARAVAGVSMLGCTWHGGGAAHAAMAGHLDHESASHAGGHGAHSEAMSHHSSCDGSCGDCCVGVSGLPAAGLPVVPPLSRVKPLVLAATPYVGHDPEGPERPPRHFVS